MAQETVFEADTAIPESIPVDPMDLCSLLGNVLDNALEAAARLPADQRHISLSARVEKGLFAVKVSNTYLFLERGIDGRLSTLKKNRKNHGYGLVSVPLRYNKDKRKNPVFSRVSAFVVAYSIPFPTLIVNEKSVE